MNRNSGNVSKTKKLISGLDNKSKLNRKLFYKLSDSSSISSNRNSSAHSEEDVRKSGANLRSQVAGNASHEEQEQVMKKLQTQVKDLRHKLRVLEESVDSKDYSLGTMAREKDRAIGEIRRLERSNKQLRQQLNDERNHYLEEKEKFCDEMSRYKKKLQESKSATAAKKPSSSKQSLISQSLRWQLNKEKGDFAESKTTNDFQTSKPQKSSGFKERKSIRQSSISLSDSQIQKPESVESLHLYEGDDVSLQMTALRTENAKLRSIICERDERNYELCLRFLRMKHYKNDIKNRFQDLENEYLQVIANLMDKIDEARQEFNFIIDQKFKRPLHSTNAMYLQMVQRNSRMTFENASLRLENQCLKKELNKYMNNASEMESRKLQPQSTTEDMESKVTLEDANNERKLKRIKKNVNFKEIRTIYERDLNFKNSDTDSNYMSKTSTTAPSNVSLGDPKSNESIVEDVQNAGNKHAPNFKGNALPDDILNKIFKRIDTSSSQSLDSIRPKEVLAITDAKSKTDAIDRMLLPAPSEKDTQLKPSQPSDKATFKDELSARKQEGPVIIEHKNPPKITDSSSPCESKESVQFDAKERARQPRYSSSAFHQRMEEAEKDYLPMRREGNPELPWGTKNRTPFRRGSASAEFEEGFYLDLPLKRFTLSGRNRMERHEVQPQTGEEGDVPQLKSRFRSQRLKDGCGLQEKLDISDLELPPSAVCLKTDTAELAKTVKDRLDRTNTRVIFPESEDEKTSRCLSPKALPPAIGSRSKSSNKLNLHEELLEATRQQQTSEEFVWKKEGTFLSLSSRYSTKSQKTDHDNIDKSAQCDLPAKDMEVKSELTHSEEVTPSRKPEASKRFSHRLVSTSPEQLRSLLTDSQLGAFQMAPIIVGHAKTEVNQPFKYGDQNEIFLQVLIPPQNKPTPHIFLDKDAMEKETLEKEISPTTLSPVGLTVQSSNPAETCSSDIRIHVSSLPTSSSTMEMVESVPMNDRSNIMMRTLSAPGLLESNWLDPYTVCETRDCSTNT